MAVYPWSDPVLDGDNVTTVFLLEAQLSCSTFLAATVVGNRCVALQFDEPTDLGGFCRVTTVGWKAKLEGDLTVLQPLVSSSWFLHRAPSPTLVTDYRDVCTGMGALSKGAEAAGFRVVGANELQTKTAAVASGLTCCHVVCGDVCSDFVLIELWNCFPREAGLAAGFSCQPFSHLGDQKGRQDSRSRSLIGALRVAFLTQAPWVVLECVVPAGCNEFVLECLNGFCQACGFRWTSVELELADVWPAHRRRWWCLLTRVEQPVRLSSWQPGGPWRRVADVLQIPATTGPDVQQMLLTSHELDEFQARKPLESFVLRSNMAMPTSLHSWGAQVTACPCGCRLHPFRASRLDSKLCAVLMRVHDGQARQYRHLTPKEAALLNGLDPELPMGDDARLALTLVGQLASPLQAGWVFAHLRQQLGCVAADYTPAGVLLEQCHKLIQSAGRCGFRLVAEESSEVDAAIPSAVTAFANDAPAQAEPFLVSGVTGLPSCIAAPRVGPPPAAPQVPGQATPSMQPDAWRLAEQGAPCPLYHHSHAQAVHSTPTAASGGLPSAALQAPGQAVPDTARIPQGPGPLVAGAWVTGNGTLSEGNCTEVEVAAGSPACLAALRVGSPIESASPRGQEGLPSSPWFGVRPEPHATAISSIEAAGQEPYVVTVSREVTAASLLAEVSVDQDVLAWRLRSKGGRVMASHDRMGPGDQVCVDFARDPPSFMLDARVEVDAVPQLLTETISGASRAALADALGHWLSDDVIAVGLAEIAQHHENVSVWSDPLLLTASTQAASPDAMPRFGLEEGQAMVGACTLQGHWVSFCWQKVVGKVFAWCSVHGAVLAEEVGVVNWLFSRASGEGLGQFRFCRTWERNVSPGMCGHAALVDLQTHLHRRLPWDDASVNAQVPLATARHLACLRGSGSVRRPCLVAGVVGPFLEQGLAGLLREKGVPELAASTRAKDLIARAGPAAIQQAMVSSQPWRQLKSMCTNLVPSFQLVLPVELQAQITKKVQAGEDVRPRRKPKAKTGQSKDQGPRPPVVPSPAMLEVPVGVFVCEGADLQQITLAQFGPDAMGIALATLSEAQPYLGLTKPMSAKALGLLVLGTLSAGEVKAPSSQVRFQARWRLSGDPLLLQATLLQLGEAKVSRFEPKQLTPVEVVKSALVRVAAYRDELSMPWDELVRSPLKAVVSLCPKLTGCERLGCDCPHYHGDGTGADVTPILEAFGRQYLLHTLKQTQPEAAQIFNVVLRVPDLLVDVLQGFSGVSGLYFEPRGATLREASSHYAVVWVPKADNKQAHLLRQTNAKALGIARVGDRYGVRCRVCDAAALHGALRPDRPFLAPGQVSIFHVGPWPHGTQRSAVIKALQAFGWTATATQPVAGPSPNGPWWQVQAASAPPADVIRSEVGDILVVAVPHKPEVEVQAAPVIASRAVLQQLQAGPSVVSVPVADEERADPWAAYLKKRGPAASGGGDRPAIVNQVAQEVLGKLQAPEATAAGQFKQMADTLRSEVMQQVRVHVEGATNELGARVMSLESQVAGVEQRVEGHGDMLRSMFQEQMSRIEELMAPKRARQE